MVKGKNVYVCIIGEFEDGKIDIFVGIQMVIKGLDFEWVGVVGVLSVDQFLQFFDFWVFECGFYLMCQVVGWVGWKYWQGQVVIQVFNIVYFVIKEVIDGNYLVFFYCEFMECSQFGYLFFVWFIWIMLKYKKL